MPSDQKDDEFYPLDLQKIPRHWTVAAIGRVIPDIKNGFASGRHNIERVGVPHLRPMNISRKGEIVLDEVKYVAGRDGFDLGPDDVLFNNTNSRELVGKTAPIISKSNWTFSNHMTRLRAPVGVSNKFVAFQLHFLWMSGYFKQICTQHVNQASISSGTLARSIRLVIPPYDEQVAIAGALEQRMQLLETVSNSLHLVRAKLERLQKLVFRRAMEGTLVPTEHALAQAAGRKYQTGAELLQEILSESKQQMEIHLDSSLQVTAKGEAELSLGWVWARVDQVGDVLLGRQRAPKYQKGEFMRPYLRVANVYEDRIDTTDVLRMNFAPQEFERFRLEYGDVLLNEGQSLEWVGRPAMFRNEVEGACFQNTLLRFRARHGVSAGFALMVFRYYLHSGEFQKIARWSTNIAHLGRERFAAMRFPLPPLAEQERIVAEGERILSIGESQQKVVEDLTTRLFSVRRKLFEEGFQGELPPLNSSQVLGKGQLQPIAPEASEGTAESGRRGNEMPKKRTTDDVKQGLYEVLVKRKSRISPERLFEESGIRIEEVDAYFEELKREVAAGRIRQYRDGQEVLLAAV